MKPLCAALHCLLEATFKVLSTAYITTHNSCDDVWVVNGAMQLGSMSCMLVIYDQCLLLLSWGIVHV